MLVLRRKHADAAGQIYQRIEDRSTPDLMVGGNLADVTQELLVEIVQIIREALHERLLVPERLG
jgi:hypothetical protein